MGGTHTRPATAQSYFADRVAVERTADSAVARDGCTFIRGDASLAKGTEVAVAVSFLASGCFAIAVAVAAAAVSCTFNHQPRGAVDQLGVRLLTSS